MTRPRHYVPNISRSLVRVLYYESKHRQMPMTRLVDELLSKALIDTPGWRDAMQVERCAPEQGQQEIAAPTRQDQQHC